MSYPPVRGARARSVTLLLAAFAVGAPLGAQSEATVSPGDVVRVDRDFVGTLMAIDQGDVLTVIGEGKPVCWPGIGHGDAPRCDPAPSVRRVVQWRDVMLERQLVELSYTKRTLVGFLIGAVALAPVGYATGPSLGYGKVDGCIDIALTPACTDPLPPEEFERRQRAQDQKRGAFAGALLGGSVGAIVARKTANEWIEVRPPELSSNDGAWTVGIRLAVAGH